MSEESCSESDYIISDSDIEDALYTISSHEQRELIRKNYIENDELPDYILEEAENLREEKRLENELIEEEEIHDEYYDKEIREEVKESMKEDNLDILNEYNENIMTTLLQDININNPLSVTLNIVDSEDDSENDNEDNSKNDNEDKNNSSMDFTNIIESNDKNDLKEESPIVCLNRDNKRKLSDTEEKSCKKIKTDFENDVIKQLEKYEDLQDKKYFKEEYLGLLITQCFNLIEEIPIMDKEIEKMYDDLECIEDKSKDNCDNKIFSVINIKNNLLIKHPELTDYDKELTMINKVRLEQLKTDLIIPRSIFERLVEEIGKDYNSRIEFNDEAIEALQTAAEDYLINLFEISNKLCIHAKRDIVKVKDVSLSKHILKF